MDDTTQQDPEPTAVDSLHEALEKDDIELARDIVATLHPFRDCRCYRKHAES